MPEAANFRVACVQLCPGEDVQNNTRAASAWVHEAATQGARLVLLPEYAGQLHASGRVMQAGAMAEDAHPLVAAMQELACLKGLWILLGSVTVPAEAGRIANRSLLISDTGDVVERYDKIHMFDAQLPSGRVIRESSIYRPGDEAVVASTPWGGLGLSICYDLRFAYLYRALAQAGASFLSVPAAFTSATGPMHWEVLLRSRAIETGCYVFAPATCGQHPGAHATHGHSLIIDPMGRVLADGQDSPGVCWVDVDVGLVRQARQMLPCLEHTRSFTLRSSHGQGH